jgi:hypothetical protein
MTAGKFSILFLCRRIFYSDKKFRKANTFVGLLCLLWFIAATLGCSLVCIPPRKFWLPDVDGTCVKLQDWIAAIEAPNSAIDFIMIALPIRVVKDLRLSWWHKLALSMTFILGGLYVQVFMRHNLGLFVELMYASQGRHFWIYSNWVGLQAGLSYVFVFFIPSSHDLALG